MANTAAQKGIGMDEQNQKMEIKESAKAKPDQKRKKRRGKGKKWVVILVVLLILLAGGFLAYKKLKAKGNHETSQNVNTSRVTRMDISSELSASSSLSPKDTYEVTSLVEGEVIEANFEEGDVVEKGQVLYRIDSSSMDSSLSSAQTSLLRAQEKLATANSDYAEEAAKIAGNTYRSTTSAYIKTLYVKEGDKVNNGTKIADLYDDSIMKLTVPFLSGEAETIQAGDEATVTLNDTAEEITGTVTVVSSLEETLSGGRLVKNVTIEVENPGGLTTDTSATATINGMICSAEATFTPKTESTLSVELSGNKSLEIETLLVHDGSYIEKNTELFRVTTKSAEEYLKEFKDSVDSAKDSLENSENQLSNTQDNVDDYTITAPIAGTVITKNVKVGDKISKSSSGSTTMAVIYDLSAMTFEMSVDELDVSSVKVGQTVEVTADAIDGVTFTGTVTNVSLQSSYSNGVTNYPVTVTMTDTGDLLPGMNVNAKIILESSKDALVVPAGALMRGNRVYVKNNGDSQSGTDDESDSKESKKTGGQNAPDGFTAAEVTTGIINDDYVEILSGLSEGDEVYVAESTSSGQTDMFMGGDMGGGPGDGGNGGGPGGGGNGGGPGGGGNGGGARP